MSKQNNIYKGHLDYQSEFDHKWACWATNHRGWAKMKSLLSPKNMWAFATLAMK